MIAVAVDAPPDMPVDATIDAIIVLVHAKQACYDVICDYEKRVADWIYLGGDRPADLGWRLDYLEGWRAVANALDYLERHP